MNKQVPFVFVYYTLVHKSTLSYMFAGVGPMREQQDLYRTVFPEKTHKSSIFSEKEKKTHCHFLARKKKQKQKNYTLSHMAETMSDIDISHSSMVTLGNNFSRINSPRKEGLGGRNGSKALRVSKSTRGTNKSQTPSLKVDYCKLQRSEVSHR